MTIQAGQARQDEATFAEKAKTLTGDALGAASERIKDRIDDQMQDGATYLERVAVSLRLAAEDLKDEAPLAANVATMCANRLDDVADKVSGRSPVNSSTWLGSPRAVIRLLCSGWLPPSD